MNAFVPRAESALEDPGLGVTMRKAGTLLTERRELAAKALPEFEILRLRARAAKFDVLRDLAGHVERFEAKASANGARVHWAQDGAQASHLIQEILAKAGAKKVVKSKSMVTEEIHLNAHLEKAGLKVVETDLGEYVAQLRREAPSHIILPIIHLSRQQVAATFAENGLNGSPEVPDLVEAARLALRREFETADAGITGANFAVADQGALCVVSNEGNARLTMSLPRVHIAVLGIEKLVPNLESLGIFLQLLARSATGQRLTVYSNLLWPGRSAADGAGPKESHIVLLDNGRSKLLASQAAEILACIRCGACLNACPIYKSVGGHAYGGTYPGPMGSILSPALGLKQGSDLAFASTLCGACKDACPVKIDIPRMLLYYRTGDQFGKKRGWLKALAIKAWGALASRPRLYAAVLRPGRLLGGGWLEVWRRLPFGWTRRRALKLPAKKSLLDLWEKRDA